MSVELASRFRDLFQGSEVRHVVYRANSSNGTAAGLSGRETAFIVDGAPTLTEWEEHLNGKTKLGIIPARQKTNDCKFGAISISNGNEIPSEIQKRIQQGIVVASLAGKGHIFTFFKDWTDCNTASSFNGEIAAISGNATAKTYPAVSFKEGGIVDGNAVVMPYFGPTGDRYALTPDNKRMEPAEFLDAANRIRLGKTELQPSDISQPDSNGVRDTEKPFEDGPPCLERLLNWANRNFGATDRQTILFNSSIYANLKWPGSANLRAREEFLLKVNDLLPEPLPISALTDTLLTPGKEGKLNKYKFQCQKSPLKNYCNAKVCNCRPFGIKAYQGACVRSLTKVVTEPPVWVVSVNDTRIQLTTEELFNRRLFQQRVLEYTNIMIPTMKESDWQEQLQDMVKDIHTIVTFESSNTRAVLVEKIHVWLYDWVQRQTEESSLQDVCAGLVYKEVTDDGTFLIFLPETLYSHLKADSKNGLIPKVNFILVESFEATEIRPNIIPRRRCYSVPYKYAETQPEIKQTLEVNPF